VLVAKTHAKLSGLVESQDVNVSKLRMVSKMLAECLQSLLNVLAQLAIASTKRLLKRGAGFD